MIASSRHRAVLFMSAGALFLSLVPVFVKIIPPDSGVTTGQKLFARGLFSALLTGSILAAGNRRMLPGNRLVVCIRSVFGIAGMFAYFKAVEGLPVPEAVTINKLSPFFVLLFSRIFLGERFGRLHVLATATAFAGVVVILRPGVTPVGLPAILALLSAVFAGAAYTTLRELRKSDGPLVIVFWFSAAMALFFLPAALSGPVPGPDSLLPLLGIGISGATGQLLMTLAYRFAPGGEVAVYGYLTVVFAMVWQVLLFHSSPEPPLLIGSVMVMTGGWLIFYSAASERDTRIKRP